MAVVALIAVLPEYSVDMYFAWQAGQNPGSDYAHYAIANMMGANRLIIGAAWTAVAAIFWFKTRRSLVLEKHRRTEILFLGLATLHAFFIPIKGTLDWYDGLVLVGLFVCYISLASWRPCEECELHGPAELLGLLPKVKRRIGTSLLFCFSAWVILSNAELFSESLVATGKAFGINEFLLVQWLAPIASEAPEFTVAIMFALRGHGAVALGSLLSAKLSQWTLLEGMIPAVYGLSSGSFATPHPHGRVSDERDTPDRCPIPAGRRVARSSEARPPRSPPSLGAFRRTVPGAKCIHTHFTSAAAQGGPGQRSLIVFRCLRISSSVLSPEEQGGGRRPAPWLGD